MDSEAETVMQLRSELREKEMKLTDIRLEALSSAHQLDQLREAMNRMQVCAHTHTYIYELKGKSVLNHSVQKVIAAQLSVS